MEELSTKERLMVEATLNPRFKTTYTNLNSDYIAGSYLLAKFERYQECRADSSTPMSRIMVHSTCNKYYIISKNPFESDPEVLLVQDNAFERYLDRIYRHACRLRNLNNPDPLIKKILNMNEKEEITIESDETDEDPDFVL